MKGIARSKGVDGKWRLLFTTTKGNSSGKLGPLVGEVLQEIDTDAGLCEFRSSSGALLGGDWKAGVDRVDPCTLNRLTYLQTRNHTTPERTDVNFVRLFGGAVEGALEATWEVTGPNAWKVIFQNISFKILGVPAVDKKPLPNQAGVWTLTYLDDELRVLYAAGLTNQGKPAKVSNIYILKRV